MIAVEVCEHDVSCTGSIADPCAWVCDGCDAAYCPWPREWIATSDMFAPRTAWQAYHNHGGEPEGTIVSVICTAGWHGEACDESRRLSSINLRCSCTCHEVKA